MTKDLRTLNAFSVDVEDYFHVSAFEGLFPRGSWGAVPLRVDVGLNRILDLLDARGVKGTFYVLGWLARRSPDAVRRIASRGHELGCHSAWHRLVYDMQPSEFREDLRDARKAIADATGGEVHLYRAPSYSIVPRSAWALRILAEEGILIDSSVYPVRHDRYGWPGMPLGPFRPFREFPDFVEFPPSAVRVAGVPIPCAGGGYLRIFPLAMTKAAIRRIQRVEGRAAMLYVHPWELDPEQPQVAAGALTRVRHRMNLHATEDRLDDLLRTFRFGKVSDVIRGAGGAQKIPFAATAA